MRESDLLIDQTTLVAKIRRGIEEYEQGKVYRVKEGIVDGFLVGTGVIFFLFIIYKFPVSIMHIGAGQPSSST